MYMKPSKEFWIGPEKLVKIVKPLYDLAESGEYWGKTLRTSLLNKMIMSTSTVNEALYTIFCQEQLNRLCATYVDNILQAGTEESQKM